jgi:DNA-binding CsgD family transcriptional regulator
LRLGLEAREISELAARRQYLASGLAQLFGTAALALLSDGELHVKPRTELVGDRDRQRSRSLNQYFAPAHLDGGRYAARRAGAGSVDGGVLVRARGERRLSDEDRALVELFFEGLAPLWHPVAPPPWIQKLPPRLKRVLDLLLQGLSEKEVADRAGLTRATAHQYVVELYRRAKVTSRAQLMARIPPTI